MEQSELRPWSVRAVNLPEHGGNPIHTDEGARAAGFDAALVAGVTTYAYVTRPAVDRWGLDWIRHGSGEVKLLAPVLDGDDLECVPVHDGLIEARARGKVLATLELAAPTTKAPDDLADGDALEAITVELTGDYENYGARAGDDSPVYPEHGVIHPAVWPHIANSIFKERLVKGAWIHTRSRIQHHAEAPVGATVTVSGNLLSHASNSMGVRAVADLRIHDDDRIYASVEHDALVSLHEPS